ncbi:MAG: hypothetical protein ABI384_06325 [Allobranchiibius sp.]
MDGLLLSRPRELDVGGLTRQQLRDALKQAEVQLNEAADTLLANADFDHQQHDHFMVVEHTVQQLGLEHGATSAVIFSTASELGLALCPAITGPYLRLAALDQESAPDSVMSNGSAPSASVTVASAPLVADDEYPKGFYLRAVNGAQWLRGYWSGDDHVWSPGDRFAFRQRA